MAIPTRGVDYYTVLGLPIPQFRGMVQMSTDEVKKAYRLALLLHHPDKVTADQIAKKKNPPIGSEYHFSVDQILEAFETLVNPTLRSRYDEALLRDKARLISGDQPKGNEGLDTFDLEDLEYSEDNGHWSKSCRCGGTYLVTIEQLEPLASEQEIVVSCHGCSLCIIVTFDAVEENNVFST